MIRVSKTGKPVGLALRQTGLSVFNTRK